MPALSFESSSASSSLTNIKYSFSDSSQGLYNQFIVTFSHGFVAQHAPNADTLLSNVESNNMVDAIKYNFADKFGYTVSYSHTIAIKNSVVINISNYISSDNIDSFIESAKDISGVEDIFPDYNIDYQGIYKKILLYLIFLHIQKTMSLQMMNTLISNGIYMVNMELM